LIETCLPFKQGLCNCDAGILHELDNAWANVLVTVDCEVMEAIRVETKQQPTQTIKTDAWSLKTVNENTQTIKTDAWSLSEQMLQNGVSTYIFPLLLCDSCVSKYWITTYSLKTIKV
jgi:hypothetical protein